jgi:predicted dehydrogenase
MGMRIGICGAGGFAGCFIPLFKAHPEVDEVILCDLKPEKLKEKCDEFGIDKTCPSLDELCQTSVDAIVIITQHHLHAPQAMQALRSGKHVYSAVPTGISVEEVSELVRTVEETGLIYMLGETSYYSSTAVYCRDRFRKGDFGLPVYSEGQYYHDYIHGMYEIAQIRFGEGWEKYFGIPPMFYPTHSTGMVVSALGSHATHLSAQGFVDRHEDNLYAREDNFWKNPFSNETMLCKMSDGSISRISEYRRIGHPGTEGMSLYGTEASYEERVGGRMWVTKNRSTCVDITEELACDGVPADSKGGQWVGVSRVHPVDRLPKEFIGLPNGHAGSHQFLVDDFVKACICKEHPRTNVWQAARYVLPGLIAHESAMAGGTLMEVPDFGDPHAAV